MHTPPEDSALISLGVHYWDCRFAPVFNGVVPGIPDRIGGQPLIFGIGRKPQLYSGTGGLRLKFPDTTATALTINVVAAAATYTRTTGSYLTDGFYAGQAVVMSGFTSGGNNGAKTILSIDGTGAIMTLTSGAGLSNEAGNNNERVRGTCCASTAGNCNLAGAYQNICFVGKTSLLNADTGIFLESSPAYATNSGTWVHLAALNRDRQIMSGHSSNPFAGGNYNVGTSANAMSNLCCIFWQGYLAGTVGLDSAVGREHRLWVNGILTAWDNAIGADTSGTYLANRVYLGARAEASLYLSGEMGNIWVGPTNRVLTDLERNAIIGAMMRIHGL